MQLDLLEQVLRSTKATDNEDILIRGQQLWGSRGGVE